MTLVAFRGRCSPDIMESGWPALLRMEASNRILSEPLRRCLEYE